MTDPTLILGDCLEEMAKLEAGSVDLTVTSPPYDSLRSYNGKDEDWNEAVWQSCLESIFSVTKEGGVLVWVVSDATVKGSETGTSFRQALYAMHCGFNLHDTMIWAKPTFSAVGALKVRYAPVFEYMFVFSKGKMKTFNPIQDRPNKYAGLKGKTATIRGKNGETIRNKKSDIADYGQRFNIWEQSTVSQRGGAKHPAPFPLRLAEDHVVSWSNAGDTVLDPFMGSGTTGAACQNKGRNFIGIEKDPTYFMMCEQRILDGGDLI